MMNQIWEAGNEIRAPSIFRVWEDEEEQNVVTGVAGDVGGGWGKSKGNFVLKAMCCVLGDCGNAGCEIGWVMAGNGLVDLASWESLQLLEWWMEENTNNQVFREIC